MHASRRRSPTVFPSPPPRGELTCPVPTPPSSRRTAAPRRSARARRGPRRTQGAGDARFPPSSSRSARSATSSCSPPAASRRSTASWARTTSRGSSPRCASRTEPSSRSRSRCPVTTDAPIKLDGEVALRDAHNELLGIMTVEEIYAWDRATTARHVLGTEDLRHPLVAEMAALGRRSTSSGQLADPRSCRRATTSRAAAHAGRRSARAASPTRGAAASSPSRRATPCTGRTRS